jgi:Rrf2 family transcriptional regulator, iron-sulfur cluster assembly transcription factor
MIYSRSTEYAIRAFIYLASVPEGKYGMAKQIAKQCDIPEHYLAKILQQQVHKGFLSSSKGPTGGFRLRVPAAELSMLQLVDTVDGLNDYQRCPGGMTECNDSVPCGLHDTWNALRSRIIDYLEHTSIEDLARALAQKKKNLEMAHKSRRSTAKKGLIQVFAAGSRLG